MSWRCRPAACGLAKARFAAGTIRSLGGTKNSLSVMKIIAAPVAMLSSSESALFPVLPRT
jgi:hypothetical protein